MVRFFLPLFLCQNIDTPILSLTIFTEIENQLLQEVAKFEIYRGDNHAI